LQPKPYLPISAPVDFAAELARDAHGGYETLGWAMPTNPLKDHRDSGFEAQAFFGAVERIQANRERLLRWGLDDADAWDVYYQVFYAPDRVSHMFFRETDPGHPHYDADYAAQPVEAWGRRFPLGDAVLESYREMDRIVGEVLDRIEAGEFGDDALLLVVSDHGFTSFRRGVNLNNALYELGLLHFSRDMTLDEVLASGRTDFLAFVDWDRTSAYSMGLGKIYVNLKGREPRGIVEPADVPLLIAQVREGLLALRDGPGGARVVTSVSHRDELFHGPWVHEGSDLVQKVAGEPRPLPHWDGYADLFVGFAPGYRVSWATTLGGLGPETLVDNTKHWTGGHVSVDPSHVPGILFANQAWADQGEASLLDIGPTIVARYGIDLDTTGMEGRALELAGSGSD